MDQNFAYKNNQQDALYKLIYYFKSALHDSGEVFALSGEVFAHYQEYVTIYSIW
jgi:hypothetical protein